jgi:NAD(P)-dependent dehydrogenase (short-subunit alcohol dehydrogenase family)
VIAIFGGGEIAEKGIVPVVGGTVYRPTQDGYDVTDSRNLDFISNAVGTNPFRPEQGGARTVIFTAGVSHPASVADGSRLDWRNEIEVNLIGAYNVASAALLAGAKTLIFIASLAGLYGKPNHSGYSASKAGLISLVQSLAMEGHNAYAISPGRVNTAMRERDYPGEDPRTRLDPLVIGRIVADILASRYTPGDNIVIRMRGHQVQPIEVHRGDGWRERLRVGEPPTC